MPEFQEFPKMARLSREVIVTEKIDGTNAAVVIEECDSRGMAAINHDRVTCSVGMPHGKFALSAQSRTRLITPQDDNFGFAAWVYAHAAELVAGLGAGRHYGEFWGAGIQRRYGLDHKRFSLFNTIRWAAHDEEPQPIPNQDPTAPVRMQQRPPACCHVVPVLIRGPFRTDAIDHCIGFLRERGSYAAPGFMKPEGIVVFHTAANVGFKKTLDRDDVPKSMAKRAEMAAA
jgi:hypothetical protein